MAEHTLVVAIAQIAGSSCQAAMAKQQLNRANVCAGFQQVNGKSVAQGMRCDRLGNAGNSVRLLADRSTASCGNVPSRYVAREEPIGGSCHPPPVAQGYPVASARA